MDSFHWNFSKYNFYSLQRNLFFSLAKSNDKVEMPSIAEMAKVIVDAAMKKAEEKPDVDQKVHDTIEKYFISA